MSSEIFLICSAVLLVICSISEGTASWQKEAQHTSLSGGDACPTITLDCPAGTSKDKPVILTAYVSGNDIGRKLTYRWSVSQGKITKGQGTSSVTVEGGRYGSDALTATVEVEGITEGCVNKTALCFVIGH